MPRFVTTQRLDISPAERQEEIDRLTAEFMERGGQVQEIPFGSTSEGLVQLVSDQESGLTTIDREEFIRRRNRAKQRLFNPSL